MEISVPERHLELNPSFDAPLWDDRNPQPRLELSNTTDAVPEHHFTLNAHDQRHLCGSKRTPVARPSELSTLCSVKTHQYIRASSTSQWALALVHFLLRIGPVITTDAQTGADSKSCGVGIAIALSSPRLAYAMIDIEVMITRAAVLRYTGLSLLWNVACSRIIPQHSEIFQHIRTGAVEDVRSLLASGKACARDATIYGNTPLHTASAAASIPMLQLLIDAGADVNAVNEDGETPLHRALAMQSNYDLARLLIENGADVFNRAVDGKTPLHTIYTDTVGQVLSRDDLLETVPTDANGMSIAHFLAWSRHSTPQIFECGLTLDLSNLWSADAAGKTCLHYAAHRGNLALLAYLLERSSPSDINKPDRLGRTVVHHSARSSRMISVLEMVLDKGADMYATDSSSQNLLHHAVRWATPSLIQTLMMLDPDRKLLVSDGTGHTPADLALQANKTHTWEFLNRLVAGHSTQAGPDQSQIRSKFQTKTCEYDTSRRHEGKQSTDNRSRLYYRTRASFITKRLNGFFLILVFWSWHQYVYRCKYIILQLLVWILLLSIVLVWPLRLSRLIGRVDKYHSQHER